MDNEQVKYHITITEIIDGETVTTEEDVILNSKEELHELKDKAFKERTIIMFQTREGG